MVNALTLAILLSLLGIASPKLTFMRTRLRWAVFGNLLTVGLLVAAWPWCVQTHAPLARCGTLAAGLALLWSCVGWVARRRLGEQGRLRAEHPSIQVAQLLCLATGLFAVLVCSYYMVDQFARALAHTWSYTVLEASGGVLGDLPGGFILLCVGLACLVTTHATHSGCLLMPMVWVLFLAVVWHCLHIPPVIPELGMLSDGITGVPSLWLMALLLATALLMSAVVAIQGHSWRSSRDRAWIQDVDYLLRPPRSWPGLEPSVAAMGLFVVVLSGLMLVYPVPAGSFRHVLPSGVCVVAALVSGVAVLAVANRNWTESLGDLGLALISIAWCAAVLAFMPSQPVGLYERFPLIFNALILGCAVTTIFWIWLGGVWQQQIADDGRPWTTAGRLVPLTRRAALTAGMFGVLFSLQMGLWGRVEEVHEFDNSAARLLWGYGCMLLLAAAVGLAYARTRRPAFRVLIMLTCVAMVFFGFMRVLPYTGLSY